MKNIVVLILFVLFLHGMTQDSYAQVITIDFEDLDYNDVVTGSEYEGLTWETGNAGLNGNSGFWQVSPPSNPGSFNFSYPDGLHNVMNANGATFMGIEFPSLVNVSGADFAGQGFRYPAPPTIPALNSTWAQDVRVHGYQGETLVGTTDWLTIINNDFSSFLDMSIQDDMSPMPSVDRIVIESRPAGLSATTYGYYGMDNLTYSVVPGPADEDGDGIYDDGDLSGIAGDNPCTGGNTQNCDDNCISVPNPVQEDIDSDGMGDVCDVCPNHAPARIKGTTPVDDVYYETIWEAYSNAAHNDTIQCQDIIYDGDFDVNETKPVKFEGGYNCDYSSVIGSTTMSGNMTVSYGVMTIEDGVLEVQ